MARLTCHQIQIIRSIMYKKIQFWPQVMSIVQKTTNIFKIFSMQCFLLKILNAIFFFRFTLFEMCSIPSQARNRNLNLSVRVWYQYSERLWTYFWDEIERNHFILRKEVCIWIFLFFCHPIQERWAVSQYQTQYSVVGWAWHTEEWRRDSSDGKEALRDSERRDPTSYNWVTTRFDVNRVLRLLLRKWPKLLADV